MSSSAQISSLVYTRYAGVLIDLAEQEKVVEPVRRDLAVLRKILFVSQALKALLASPLVSVSKDAKVLDALAKKYKMQPLTRQFLSVVAMNGRAQALAGIIIAYDKASIWRAGFVDVGVETAQELSEEQSAALREQMEEALKAPVQLDKKVSPDIIGGMIVTIDSYMVDDSVRRKIERLGRALKPDCYDYRTVISV
ncbi:MAG: ATP synthase F1 subunit delta [Alphaproteobacteria bacterium]